MRRTRSNPFEELPKWWYYGTMENIKSRLDFAEKYESEQGKYMPDLWRCIETILLTLFPVARQ